MNNNKYEILEPYEKSCLDCINGHPYDDSNKIAECCFGTGIPIFEPEETASVCESYEPDAWMQATLDKKLEKIGNKK